nr:MAG: hypothetical protein [Microvirus sp.]
MARQVIIRNISPEFQALEVACGTIQDSQFTPDSDAIATLTTLGFDSDFLSVVGTSFICPDRHFVSREHLSDFVRELIDLDTFLGLEFYPNFIVFKYES